jgi:hypothetical protein
MKRGALVGVALANLLLGAGDVGSTGPVPDSPAPWATQASGGVTATLHIDPLRVALALYSRRIRVGSDVVAVEVVGNGGTMRLHSVSVIIESVPFLSVRPAPVQRIGALGAGKTEVAKGSRNRAPPR